MAESPTPSVAPSQLFFKNNLMHFEAAAGIATRKEKWVRPDFGRTAENFSRPSQIKKTTGEVPRLQEPVQVKDEDGNDFTFIDRKKRIRLEKVLGIAKNNQDLTEEEINEQQKRKDLEHEYLSKEKRKVEEEDEILKELRERNENFIFRVEGRNLEMTETKFFDLGLCQQMNHEMNELKRNIGINQQTPSGN